MTKIPVKSNITLGRDVIEKNGSVASTTTTTTKNQPDQIDTCVLAWTSVFSTQIVWTGRVQNIPQSYFLLEIEMPFFLSFNILEITSFFLSFF